MEDDDISINFSFKARIWVDRFVDRKWETEP